VLRVEGASVSLCRITGRLVSFWVEPEPGPLAWALLGEVLADDSLKWAAAGGGAPRSVRVRPVARRVTFTELALLEDTRARSGSGLGAAADFLLAVERADALLSLAAPLDLGFDRKVLSEELDELALRVPEKDVGSLAAVLPKDTEVFARLARAHKTLGALDARPQMAIDRLFGAAASAPIGTRSAVPVESRSAVGPIRGTATVDDGVDAAFDEAVASIVDGGPNDLLGAFVDGDRLDLGDDAPAAAGLAPSGGTVRMDGPWCTIEIPTARRSRHTVTWWALARNADRPLGIGPLVLDGDSCRATFPTGSAPDEVWIVPHPIPLPEPFQLDDLEATDRLGYAAWCISRLGRDATAWFSRCVVANLGLGRVFRAGWASNLADRRLTERLVARQASTHEARDAVLYGLRAVRASDDLPTTKDLELRRVPLWAHVADLGALASGRPGGPSDGGQG
jgi:hypothetical protein